MQPHSQIIYDVKHWRERAESARRMAEQITDPIARDAMLQVAAEYERLAERAATRNPERSSA
ncbi:MAG TPA: hypothetical protein VF113_12410 [Stellaceae bacterium]